jgi:hypothetical protein
MRAVTRPRPTGPHSSPSPVGICHFPVPDKARATPSLFERRIGLRRCLSDEPLHSGDKPVAVHAVWSKPASTPNDSLVLPKVSPDQVDLVGNDSGGGIAQIFAALNPERVRTLTLTNCDTHDNWPPEAFKPLSEMFALRWSDICFQTMQVFITKSIVRNHIGPCKTPASRKPVPLHSTVLAMLQEWRSQSFYRNEDDFSFPSIRLNGAQPLFPDMVLNKIIRPALLRAGVTEKKIGWHSFRHSLRPTCVLWEWTSGWRRSCCATQIAASRWTFIPTQSRQISEWLAANSSTC